MAKPLHVLIVEDSENDALLLIRELKRSGYEPVYELLKNRLGKSLSLILSCRNSAAWKL
jgi:hypothetical protein